MMSARNVEHVINFLVLALDVIVKIFSFSTDTHLCSGSLLHSDVSIKVESCVSS